MCGIQEWLTTEREQESQRSARTHPDTRGREGERGEKKTALKVISRTSHINRGAV